MKWLSLLHFRLKKKVLVIYNFMDINSAINEGSLILKKGLISSAQLDSELLMSKIIEKDRKDMILYQNEKLNSESYENFKFLISERLKKKPVAYLLGKKDFWKYQFKISEGVLIPRPDTEIIVEKVLKITKYKQKLKILDIGVGSGCLLLSILKEKNYCKGVGIDISKKCVEIARLNAADLGLLNRVKIVKSDIDNFADGKYDLIISNPPYVNKLDLKHLELDVINFEPNLALDGGRDGLSIIKKVINKSSGLLKINGKFFLEIGFDQKDKVKKLLKKKGFYINKIVKDYANNDRCIISTKI